MKIPAILAVAATAIVTLSACGGNTTAAEPAAQTSASGGAGLHVASTSLGQVLVDASGRTVYLLTADGRDQSTCSSSCLQLWPAVTPGGHAGVTAQVGSTSTPSGTSTATIAGHPVYTFANDHGAGDVNGEGVQAFGGTWYAVSPDGAAIKAAGAPASSSQSSPPAYQGSGY